MPTVDNPVLLLFLVFPGLVSMQVYRMIMPAYRIEWKSAILEGLFYGVVNLVLLSPLVYWLMSPGAAETTPLILWPAAIVFFVIAPAVWPFAFVFLVKRPLLRRYVQLPYPSAWDYFFDKRAECFVLIHLKNGQMIGGYYGPNSYATSFPNHGDIYLEAVYRVDETGTFLEPIESTEGLLISRNGYSHLELLGVPEVGLDVVAVNR